MSTQHLTSYAVRVQPASRAHHDLQKKKFRTKIDLASLTSTHFNVSTGLPTFLCATWNEPLSFESRRYTYLGLWAIQWIIWVLFVTQFPGAPSTVSLSARIFSTTEACVNIDLRNQEGWTWISLFESLNYCERCPPPRCLRPQASCFVLHNSLLSYYLFYLVFADFRYWPYGLSMQNLPVSRSHHITQLKPSVSIRQLHHG